jgi:hypothetical protein
MRPCYLMMRFAPWLMTGAVVQSRSSVQLGVLFAYSAELPRSAASLPLGGLQRRKRAG